MHYGTRTSHLNLFIFRRSPVDEYLLLARTSQCRLKIVSSLDEAEPIPTSGAGRLNAPRTALTTRISKSADCPQSTPPSRAPFTVSRWRYTYWDSVKRPRFVHLSSPFGRRVRRMSTTSSLSAYLLEQKTRFLGDSGNGWTVVMGNEAGGTPSQSR